MIKLKNYICYLVLVAPFTTSISFADAWNDPDKSTSTKDAADVSKKVQTEGSSVLDLVLFCFMAAGIVFIGLGLFHIYKAIKSDGRQEHSIGKGAFSIIIGVALCSIYIIKSIVQNSTVG